ncbi:membrane protein [Halalkalibacter akibai JCM 9157]|uniref:Membrane protein n=1 Tax=Halalkalibacter akibai (strain ATCC 43226 / DSM 21942 / CIP 109018 / JCM 9157 / 1139) TaxID=1236973 RepID=W4QNN3_HALA3|nr:membrane protein [Halalkalibacter akibai JCM 9157]
MHVNNFKPSNNERRFKAHVSTLGTTQLHLRNPYIIAWWSAAFPGFGHLLLSKYLRGYTLFLWEILINVMSKLNLAMVYSFTGNTEMAKEILEPRWFLLYIPVYLFSIWDSYRTAVDMNRLCLLAERENADFNTFAIGSFEINYLDKRSPLMAVVWSLFMPGMGQLYIHRIVTGTFNLIWIIIFVYYSNLLLAVHSLFLGNIAQATEVVNPQWLLFIPSLYGFSVYDAYVNTVENNKLYENEQRKFLQKHYQQYRVKIPSQIVR